MVFGQLVVPGMEMETEKHYGPEQVWVQEVQRVRGVTEWGEVHEGISLNLDREPQAFGEGSWIALIHGCLRTKTVTIRLTNDADETSDLLVAGTETNLLRLEHAGHVYKELFLTVRDRGDTMVIYPLRDDTAGPQLMTMLRRALKAAIA